MELDLKGVVGESPKVTRLATGFLAASGPVYSRRGYLLFCDAGADKILKLENGAVTAFRDPSNSARALTFDHQGRLLVCEKGRFTRTEKNGTVTVIASKSHMPSLQDPVDAVYAIDGNIYFCDDAALYQVRRDAKVLVASRDCERPAGLALAPDQQMLYATDAKRKNVQAFRINSDGTLEQGRIFADVPAGGLGGLKTDEDGRVWVALSASLAVFNRAGTALGTLTIPETPTNLAWAEGFRNIVATTQSSIYRIEARVNGTRTY